MTAEPDKVQFTQGYEKGYAAGLREGERLRAELQAKITSLEKWMAQDDLTAAYMCGLEDGKKLITEKGNTGRRDQ